MDDNRDVVVHVFRDVAQETRRDDGHRTKGNTGIVDIGVRVSICFLAGKHKCVPDCDVSIDTGQVQDVLDKGSTSESPDFRDDSHVVDLVVDSSDHELFGELGNELVVEDVVVSRVADSSTNDSNSQSERCDCGNEIVRADDGCDD